MTIEKRASFKLHPWDRLRFRPPVATPTHHGLVRCLQRSPYLNGIDDRQETAKALGLMIGW